MTSQGEIIIYQKCEKCGDSVPYIPIELGVVKLQHLAEVKVMFKYME